LAHDSPEEAVKKNRRIKGNLSPESLNRGKNQEGEGKRTREKEGRWRLIGKGTVMGDSTRGQGLGGKRDRKKGTKGQGFKSWKHHGAYSFIPGGPRGGKNL